MHLMTIRWALSDHVSIENEWFESAVFFLLQLLPLSLKNCFFLNLLPRINSLYKTDSHDAFSLTGG